MKRSLFFVMLVGCAVDAPVTREPIAKTSVSWTAEGRAYGLSATALDLITVGPVPDTNVENPDTLVGISAVLCPTCVTTSLSDATFTVDTTSTLGATTASNQATATTSAIAIALSTVSISATAIVATATATETNGIVTTTTAGSTIANLEIGGTTYGDTTGSATIVINDPLTSTEIAEVQLFETTTTPDGIAVNAIHAHVLGLVDVIIGHAESAVIEVGSGSGSGSGSGDGSGSGSGSGSNDGSGSGSDDGSGAGSGSNDGSGSCDGSGSGSNDGSGGSGAGSGSNGGSGDNGGSGSDGGSNSVPTSPDAGISNGDNNGGQADNTYVGGGGCSTTSSSSSSSSSSWVVLVLFAFALATRRRRVAVIAAAMGLCDVQTASADVDADMLRTTLIGQGGVAVANTDTLDPWAIRIGTLGDFASEPLELRDANTGARTGGIINNLTSLDVRAAVGLPAGFEVSVLAPLVVNEQGSTMGLTGDAIGDLGIAAKWSTRLGDRFGFAVAPELIVPTGNASLMAGDGTIAGEVQLLGDVVLGPVRLGAMTGVHLRGSDATYGDAVVGQQVLWGGVADWSALPDQHINLIAEAHGATGVTGSESPAEALGTVRWSVGDWIVVAGGGAGLNSSVGVPAWRAFVGGALTVGGHSAPRNHPSALAFTDPAPASPLAPAVLAPVPAPAALAAPAQDLDTDGDGIPDSRDACPTQPETVNGFEDADGCPDTAPTYVFAKDRPLVLDNIVFETAKWRILPESFTVLDDVAASLAEQPRVRIRIEGHTDSRGSPPENVILSQQRAIAIMNYLIAAGVDPTRLEYEGLGASRPIASNDTEAGRQANRRVEFRVVGSQSEVAP